MIGRGARVAFELGGDLEGHAGTWPNDWSVGSHEVPEVGHGDRRPTSFPRLVCSYSQTWYCMEKQQEQDFAQRPKTHPGRGRERI